MGGEGGWGGGGGGGAAGVKLLTLQKIRLELTESKIHESQIIRLHLIY